MKDFATEPAVYGIVLVAGLVAIRAEGAEESWAVLVKVVATVLVFWAAHVYAGIVAHIGEATTPTWRCVLGYSAQWSSRWTIPGE